MYTLGEDPGVAINESKKIFRGIKSNFKRQEISFANIKACKTQESIFKKFI